MSLTVNAEVRAEMHPRGDTGYTPPAWTPADGPSPWVYARLAAGHRSLLSARWNYGGKILGPADMGFDVDHVGSAMAHWELADYEREERNWNRHSAILEMLDRTARGIGLNGGDKQFLTSLRDGAGEYVDPRNPSPRTVMFTFRPGWADVFAVPAIKPEPLPGGPTLKVFVSEPYNLDAELTERERKKAYSPWR